MRLSHNWKKKSREILIHVYIKTEKVKCIVGLFYKWSCWVDENLQKTHKKILSGTNVFYGAHVMSITLYDDFR